jgi:DNA end-binding protein Ku
MAPRASWKGYLKLSLVSCPIALYPAASSSERVSFNRINKKTGNRLKQQLVDAETGETVEKEDIGRGYEIVRDWEGPIPPGRGRGNRED